MMTATIPAGEALSSAVYLEAQKLASLLTTAAWDAADLAVEAADPQADGTPGTFYPVCKDEAANPEYLIPFASGKRVALDNGAMALATLRGKWVRFRSVVAEDSTTTVDQTVEVAILLDVKD